MWIPCISKISQLSSFTSLYNIYINILYINTNNGVNVNTYIYIYIMHMFSYFHLAWNALQHLSSKIWAEGHGNKNKTANSHVELKSIWKDLNNEMYVYSVTQLCLTFCDHMDCSPPGSSVHGIFQARLVEWVAIPFSRGSSWPQGSNSYLLCLPHW